MYVHLMCGGCAVRGPRSVIGALTLQEMMRIISRFGIFIFRTKLVTYLQRSLTLHLYTSVLH